MKKYSVMNRYSTGLLAGAAISAIGVCAASADEIVVTASKRVQTLQEVPIAVSVVDAATIEKAQMRDLIDLSSMVPSLRVGQLQNVSQTTFSIRGFGNGANNPGIEGSVGVFVDGVYRSRSASAMLDLPTLERVEVLRGPQSTLFGKNVSAGAISITTKLPQFEWGGSAEASYGNYEQVLFKGTLTGPITDTLAFRVSGSTNNADGYYTNIVDGTDQNERDRWSVRGQLLWEPSDTLSFRMIGDYNKIDENCCGAITLLNGPATQGIGAPVSVGGLGEEISDASDPFSRNIAANAETFNVLKGKGLSLQADWDLGFAQLTSITAYREQTDYSNTDVDFTGADLAELPLDRTFETFTQEVRLTSIGDNRFDWMVGGFFFDEDVFLQRNLTFGAQQRQFVDGLLTLMGAPGALDDLETALSLPVGDTFYAADTGVYGTYNMDNRSYSFFGQFDYEITDRLTLSGGLSFIDDSKKATGLSILTEPLSNIDMVGLGFAGAFSDITMLDATPENIAAAFDNPVPVAALMGGVVVDPATGMPITGVSTVGALSNAISLTACDDMNPALLCNPVLPLTAVQFFAPQINFPDPTNSLDNGRVSSNDLTWTARLAYDVTDNINAYFTYATGYKAGAFNLSSDSRPPDPVTGYGRTAQPEDVRLFEIGAKANFDGGYINVAVFDQTIEGFQSNAFNGAGFDLVNAGKQSVRGFEVESLYRPVAPLTLTFGLTYLDPEFDSFTMAGCTPFDTVNCSSGENFRDLSGTRVPGIHEISMTTSAIYTHDFNDWLSGFARIEYVYESEVALIENIPPSFTREVNTFNASIGFQTEDGFDVMFWGRNITNDEYIIQGFPTVVQTGSVSGYANAPRTYGVTVRKSF